MIINERDCRKDEVINVAKRMMTAARTAPKSKGIDIIELSILTDDDIIRLSEKMKALYSQNQMKFFLRDSDNILQADALLLLGTKRQQMSLNCGYCGYPSCSQVPNRVPCALNDIDLGIAIGSACAMAADCRVDTRVMFSAGLAAQALSLLDNCNNIIAIAISASSKNPFFDRKPKS